MVLLSKTKMLIPLTKKEQQVLEFVKSYSLEKGIAPTLHEIKDHFQLKAVSTVHEHLQKLKQKGYLTNVTSHARSSQVVDCCLNEQNFLEIPCTYRLTSSSVLETLDKAPNIYLHKSQLNDKGRYFAVMVATAGYTEHGINIKDVLVFKEVKTASQTGVYAVVSHNKFFYLAKPTLAGKTKIFQKLDAKASIINKCQIKGKLMQLVRDCR